jgi:amino acid transporter
VLYGLGTTIGAGIYALLGEVAGLAGIYTPFAFLVAAVLASLTALSFCELSARLPHAGGEAVYVGVGFDSRTLSRFVGISIALAACVSAATVARGFVGYVSAILPLGDATWVALLLIVLGVLAAWGIEESARVAAVLTLVEAGGLVAVIIACRDGLASAPGRFHELLPAFELEPWVGIGSATLLCFYAFLGFEDMVNVAEEVRDVRRSLPRAIVTTLGITLVLYLLLTVAAVFSLPPDELARSKAPLVDLFVHATGRSGNLLRWVGVLAMLNGALIQLIKATRIVYGLSRRGELPSWLGVVHARRRTPVFATALAVAVSLVFALALPIAPLARLTSGITLAVFALANLALLRIQSRDPRPAGVPRIPTWVPAAGALVSVGLLVFEILRLLARA